MFPYDLVFTLGVLGMFMVIVTVTSLASVIRERLQTRQLAADGGDTHAAPPQETRRAA